MSDWKDTGTSNGHIWGIYKNWLFQSCKVCGKVRRADDKNTQCRGYVKVSLRKE